MNISLKSALVTTLALGMAFPTAVFARGWDKNSLNDPNGFNVNWHPTHYSYNLSDLLDSAPNGTEKRTSSGTVINQEIPWGDSYWPSNRGGPAYRWKEFQRDDMDQALTAEQRMRLFFKVHRYPRSELLVLKATNQAEYKRVMSNLSPLEKYALYVSNTGDNEYYDSPILNEFTKSKQAEREYWEGYCHAWAPVASHYAEPLPVTKVTKDGLEIPFYTGDVKALLVANYQQKTSNTFGGALGRFFNKNKRAQVRFVGKRCDKRFQFPIVKTKNGVEMFADYGDTDGLTDAQYLDYARKYQAEAIRLKSDLGEQPAAFTRDANGNIIPNANFISEVKANMDACENTNAGAFHIVMANQLGKMHEGFLFDKTRDVEVWNQPAFKYVSELEPLKDANGNALSRLSTSAPNTASVVHVKTKLYYADDSDYGWAYSYPTLLSLFNVGGSYQSMVDGFKAELAKYSRLLMHEGDETEALKYPQGVLDAAHYEYTLDIDASGAIIGGDWISYDRPDYLWIMKKEAFFDDFKRLAEVYQPVQFPTDQIPNFGDL